ncbi:hypothetical protein [Mangrovibrevibacter kandeliae]|uniref:hypothetical protein n=1 Tax=Mangrovibrevibacter kandeliae TaxID=2968473 RepID=UPI0021174838|nr:hypothetical protein [Aurantimonas sp. CSK15Z-1]MCQ8782906.1 hypothetical protein [Aurantimonas sp. CSK15Z-1]
MVNDQTWGVTPNDQAVRDAVRTLYYAANTTDAETTNPMAPFVGVNGPPTHALFVGGRLHAVQVGWSKSGVEEILRDQIRQIVAAPERVNSPPFAAAELGAIRQALAGAESNHDERGVLTYMAPTLAAEIRRIAGCVVWSDWVHDYVQTELRKGLAASMTALGPNPQPMSPMEIDVAASAVRAISNQPRTGEK